MISRRPTANSPSIDGSSSRVEASATQAVSNAGSRKLELLSRAGYVAKGIVYATIGVVVLSALYGAFGNERLTGARGAVDSIAEQPFGQVLLIMLIVGLIGYVVWRFVQGIKDTEGKGDDFSGWMQRIGFMISGIFYTSLAFYAVKVAGWFSNGTASASGGESSKQALTERLMSYEAGIWGIGIAGAIFVGVGIYQFYRALTRKFEDSWKTHEVPNEKLRFARRVAQFGICARAVTFVLSGGLLVLAAVRANPDQARGLGYALRTLRDEPYGTFLLTVIGAGLVCYGVYCFVNARYRTVNV
jgi:hypothetical protein